MARKYLPRLALAGCVAALGLAACGGDDSGGNDSETDNAGAGATTTAAASPRFQRILDCFTEAGLEPEEEPVPVTVAEDYGVEHDVFFEADDTLKVTFYASKDQVPLLPPTAGSSKNVVVGTVVINSVTGVEDDTNMRTAEACL